MAKKILGFTEVKSTKANHREIIENMTTKVKSLSGDAMCAIATPSHPPAEPLYVPIT